MSRVKPGGTPEALGRDIGTTKPSREKLLAFGLEDIAGELWQAGSITA